MCWEVRKGGRLCWCGSWQHPKNHPALPRRPPGPPYSPAPLVTLSLSPLSISQAVRLWVHLLASLSTGGAGCGLPKAGRPRAAWTLER